MSSSWNKLVSYIQKNFNEGEKIVQKAWELLFSTVFDYPDSDIHPQFPMQMGSSPKFADILIQHDDKDLFVVELKRHTLHKGQAQLFSYLNQLKIDIGILVCDKLYVYDFDYTKKDGHYSFVEIAFSPDNPDGIKFVELFTSSNFDKQKIKDFIAQKNQSKANAASIRKELTADFILQLVTNHLTEKYPVEDVASVLDEFQISVAPKSRMTAGANLNFSIPVTVKNSFSSTGSTKDNTQYKVNGSPTGGKGPTVYAAVDLYVKTHPNITFGELQEVFPDATAKPGFGKMLRLFEQVSKNQWNGSRFKKQPIVLASEQQVAVSTQWKPDNMRTFIEYANRAGITIEPV